MSEHAKTINVMRDGWVVPQRVWYRTAEALMAEAGEKGWWVASKDEARDFFLRIEDTGKTVCVAFDHAQVELAQDRAEGSSVGRVRFATDQEVEKYWEDRKAQEAAYREKLVQRKADEKRTTAGGPA